MVFCQKIAPKNLKYIIGKLFKEKNTMKD